MTFGIAVIGFWSTSVAVKVPLPEYSSGLGSWSMFQREAELGKSLSHPNIVRFIALEPDKHRQYIVMEYLVGESLLRQADLIGATKALLGET